MTPSVTYKPHNDFGLMAADLQNIIAVLQQHTAVEEAFIFGSRAKGNYKNGSDIDIALKGSAIDHSIVSNISYVLNEETPMPYKFDLVNYHAIVNAHLREHINRAGLSFYKRG